MTTQTKNFDKQPVQLFGTQAKTPTKVMVYKCGDKHDKGKQFLLKDFRTLDQFQRKVAQQVGFMPSIRGLYTCEGKLIRNLDEIEDKSILIAVRTGETFGLDKLPYALSN